jgi:acyl-CoA reductase-like NAD-dependent aldehyde dehydrogenase
MAVRESVGLRYPGRFFIDGTWADPSTDSLFDVVDSATEQVFLQVAEAKGADIRRAVEAARRAFDNGPWPRLTHLERAEYLRAIAQAFRARADVIGQVWPRQSGVLHSIARNGGQMAAGAFTMYADMAGTFAFQESAAAAAGGEGWIVREPVGVVGAIVPWNVPVTIMAYKIAPALLAGCAVVLKASPEAPGEAYVMAEIAEEVGLPPGVLNVLTADRAVSELLVRDPEVDKISFTGSTAAGRRIASILGERLGRCTLELGGKSAAVVLDDADVAAAATELARAELMATGQLCSSLTRMIVVQEHYDDFVAVVADEFARVRLGDPFDDDTGMGPLAMARQRDRVESYIRQGVADGAKLVVGGGRPSQLPHGYFVEPTVFANVDNRSVIAQEEIFGPVLTVIRARDEDHAVALANDSIYGLNASVFTADTDRAYSVARRLRSGTVGHNAFRTDFSIAFGGYKQSGIGREGGREGLLPYLETKTVIMDDHGRRLVTP